MSDNPVQSAERIFHVLETLATADSMSLTELTAKVSLSKSTTHRLLKSLMCLNYVEQTTDGKYRLTYKILMLSSTCYTRNRLISRVHPHLLTLSANCHETVHLVKRNGTHILYLDKVDSPDYTYQMYSRIGILNELYCTATGKCLLSELSDTDILDLWPSMNVTSRTPYTITDSSVFLDEIQKVRQTGYACDRQETELGLFSIGTAIPDFTGKANYAISITAPVARITDSVLTQNIRLLLEAKSSLSKELGYQSP
ncbi:MAG: IclR family transcriptional regulator [Lachnospiraceae bacterium]|nr:IclR family transcriptional regulator [Lachnospiraceae bacterium]